jgi:hypothetical protein
MISTRLFIKISFLFLGLFFLKAINAQAPLEVKYGIYIKKINPNFTDGTFTSEFYWWVRFKNDSTKTGISNAEVLNLEYVNAVGTEVNSFSNEIVEIRKLSENEYYYHGFHQGDFYFTPDFTLYPFDRQCLHISIENTLLTKQDFILIEDQESYTRSKQPENLKGLSNDLLSQEKESFNIFKSEIKSVDGLYNTDFGDPDFEALTKYSRLDTLIYLKRPFIPYISKLIIPLIIILLLVYYVFFLPPDKLDIAAGLTVTSLLSAIAFQLAIGSELPEIGYITYSDKVFYVCYFLIALSMAQSLYTFYLDDSSDPRKKTLAKNLDNIFRFLFPILFLVPVILLAL